MKPNFLFIALLAFLLYGCNNDETECFLEESPDTESSNDSIYTYTMYLDCPYPSYDSKTRVSPAGEWEDGDALIITYSGGWPNYQQYDAQATYSKQTNTWTLVSSHYVVSGACSAYYFRGAGTCNFNPDYSTYSFDYLIDYYRGNEGNISYENDAAIRISVVLSPVMSRLRFKGDVGDEIEVSSMWDYMKIATSVPHQLWATSIKLKVNENGYTDYFLLSIDKDCERIYVKDKNGTKYWHPFTSSSLNEKESGCFTIPTKDNLHGWAIDPYNN